jgi:hypothetical protein
VRSGERGSVRSGREKGLSGRGRGEEKKRVGRKRGITKIGLFSHVAC